MPEDTSGNVMSLFASKVLESLLNEGHKVGGILDFTSAPFN